MAVTCAVNTVWILLHLIHKRRTTWSSVWFKPMMYHTSGHQDVCVTSRDVKIVQIWNQNVFLDGSGHPLARRCKFIYARVICIIASWFWFMWKFVIVIHQTVFHVDGTTTHGAELATRKSHNQTMLNMTSIKHPNHVCPCLTMCTMTVLHGMMLLATMKNRLSAKITMNCWTMSVSWREETFNQFKRKTLINQRHLTA